MTPGVRCGLCLSHPRTPVRARASTGTGARLGAGPYERYVQVMSARRPYPSDLSDARELTEPVLAAWRFERRGRALDFGRPPEHDLRESGALVTDTPGLLLAVLVTAASVQDSAAGTRLLDQVAAAHPGLRKVGVDGGYCKHFVEHAATLAYPHPRRHRTPHRRVDSAARAERRHGP
ncbi:hypothetical protein GCM10027072_45230 [Streptomyces bullii]